MMSCVKWQIAGAAELYGSGVSMYRNGGCREFASLREMYDTLAEECRDVICRKEKFVRIGEITGAWMAVSMAALLDAGLENCDFSGRGAALLGVGDYGSHEGNLLYWDDYENNGAVFGQGHYFVGTLASSALCQLAIMVGSHAPVIYLTPGENPDVVPEELEYCSTLTEKIIILYRKNGNNCAALLKICDDGLTGAGILEELL